MEQNLVNYRRTLHKIPEICFNEFKTSSFIKEELKKMGIDYKESAKTGIVAFIKGLDDFTIGFRTDMDGLAIKEENDYDFKSMHDGFMHACGHDFHMALLLGLANYYKDKTPPCNLLLIFQPAEEGGGGANKMLSEGIFNFYKKPDLIFGIHVNPEYNYNEIAYTSGNAWAGSCEFEIELNGPGGHGAQINLSTDLLYVFSNFYNTIQALLSRKKDIFEPALITIGKIKGFDVPNVFTKKATIGGTFRFFNENTYKFLNSEMVNLLDGLRQSFNFTYFYREISVYLPVKNDEKICENFEKIYKDDLEKKFKIVKSPIVMISDDVSYFLKEIPGIYFFHGVKKKDGQKLHTPDFDPDEKALITGFNLYNYFIENYKKLI